MYLVNPIRHQRRPSSRPQWIVELKINKYNEKHPTREQEKKKERTKVQTNEHTPSKVHDAQ
jgi:hypothetical protein